MVKSTRASQASIDYDLLAHIVHEARGPFNGLLGFSDILDSSFDSLPVDKQKEYIHLIKSLASKSFFQLQTLIAWIKLVSDNFTPNHSSVSITESVETSVQLLANDLKSRSVNLSVNIQSPYTVAGDPNYLNLALANTLAVILPHLDKESSLEIRTDIEKDVKGISYIFRSSYKTDELWAMFPGPSSESGSSVSEIQTAAWVAIEILDFHKATVFLTHIEEDLYNLRVQFA